MVKLKPLNEQVIVITGASSGIGLATAKAAAERGARVVLAARTRDALVQAVDEINQAHPNAASFVEADVGTHQEHEKIASHAIERHGRIDTWVNNAGVLVFGKLEDLAEADMRQLFETNFWGTVHGSIVAAKYLRLTGGGALINLGSIESDHGVPLQGIYAASKHAVKGFTDSFRMELEADGAPISVTLIKPSAIGSPLPQHTRSYEGVEPNLPRPIYTPEEAARVVLAAAEKPTPVAHVGGMGRAYSVAAGVAPRTLEWIEKNFLIPMQFSQRPADGDNLDRGASEARVHGRAGGRPSLYSAAARHPVATVAVAGGLAAGAFLLLRRGEDDLLIDNEPWEPRRSSARRPELVVVGRMEGIPVEGN